MLKLSEIRKVYVTGSEAVEALKGITLAFRRKEFVSILGASGCGKTTLLNIVGGLDKYTSGDLIINGRSTKEFGDRDWDTYRNHSIGFVFQSYNLIPHQSVLSNVELALTISGVSRTERRRMAADALRRVGLGDQLHKKPNQLSGGQMQRVAIARAIVNDPEILLADEPTGALDSVTSLQIMELLSEIAKDRLVVMVTHNPELANTYSSRIIHLSDGQLLEDSNPYSFEEEDKERIEEASFEETPPVATDEKAEKEEKKKKGKKKFASMSFLTALSLSFKNLLTKKTRTILTAFAGSIGIIGIALIQSVSSGVQAYINQVQEDTLSSYPIVIQRENTDMTALLENLMNISSGSTGTRDEDRVYANTVLFEMMDSVMNAETELNNLSKFKEFLETDEGIQQYISAVHYAYGSGITVYTKDEGGEIYRADINELMSAFGSMGGSSSAMGGMSGFGSMEVFEELLPGEDGAVIHELVKTQYDIINEGGRWPEAANEIVLVVDENNEISDLTLYALGLKNKSEFEAELMKYIASQGKPDSGDSDEDAAPEKSWSFEEICAKTYRIILNADCFVANGTGGYTDIRENKDETAKQNALNTLYNNGMELTVVGIVKKNPDATAAMISGNIGYTSLLTEEIVAKTLASDIVKAQLANDTVDVFTGREFMPAGIAVSTEKAIAQVVANYLTTADITEKAAIYTELAATIPDQELATRVMQMLQMTDMDARRELVKQALLAQGLPESLLAQMGEAQITETVTTIFTEQIKMTYRQTKLAELQAETPETLAGKLDARTAEDSTDPLTAKENKKIYEDFILASYSDATYQDNLERLGYIDEDMPTSISIYAKTFEDKDAISSAIERYNSGATEENKISYTDYVALLMSSISTVISAISYVLIAFVAISLVVSSIMISIITYISVLERTKEIGVLRAIGASKRDVSRVFNAETLIEGFVSGALGIAVTLLLLIPINLILHAVTGIANLQAMLPVGNAVALIIISMLLTVIAGIIPSGMAAKRDPVAALRSE